jgi:4-diphosphocytidyl-2-C-methyl-D-erythritol kinase
LFYRRFHIPARARSAVVRGPLRHDPPPVNDLEPAARRLCRAIDPALEALARAGAELPMVTGSGPTVFGRGDDPERVVARLREHGYTGIAA